MKLLQRKKGLRKRNLLFAVKQVRERVAERGHVPGPFFRVFSHYLQRDSVYSECARKNCAASIRIAATDEGASIAGTALEFDCPLAETIRIVRRNK